MVCDEETNLEKQPRNTLEKGIRRGNTKIAFTAIRNENPLDLSRNIIKFDYVQVNYGNAYSIRTSTFTAPMNGVYMFEFVIFKRLSRSSLTVALTVSNLFGVFTS